MIEKNIHSKLVHTSFLQREYATRHHSYDEEMLPYEYIKAGDKRGISLSIELFSSDKVGKLSNDPLRNFQYLFICATTMITRFSIEGGMDTELAYNTSDLYIQSVDQCKTIEDVKSLHTEMVTYFTGCMEQIHKKGVYAKPIVLCMDYIYYNLHRVITVLDLSSHVNLNPSYLSTLFKEQTGHSISDYIRGKRIEAAKNMLMYSNYTPMEISEYLAFSSYSHFSELLKKYTGLTPRKFRLTNFRQTVIRTGLISTSNPD